MVKFDTKLKLITYLGKESSKEGKYVVLQDETMQNKKAIYSYTNGELLLESGGTKTQNWRTSVNTFADVAGIPTPLGMDAVVVLNDETHNNNKTWYQHDGYNWIYKGAYQKRETQKFYSGSDTRGSILTGELTIPWEYIVGNDELEVYLDGKLSTQYLSEVGNVGFSSNKIKFTIDIPVSTDINVRKMVPNIDDEPRTNDEVYVNAFKHNYSDIEKYVRYEKSSVIHYDTFADAQNDIYLIKENQVIRTHGHVTKNDGKGRYWILEATDKDFGYKNKANSLFINRLVGSDEIQVGTILPVTGTANLQETIPMAGTILNRNEYKRLWAYAQASGNLVDENTWLTEGGTGRKGAYSSGDGVNTFRVPEIRGTHIRALDNGRGLDAGRVIGSYQADQLLTHSHQLWVRSDNAALVGNVSALTGAQGVPGGGNWGVVDGYGMAAAGSTENRVKTTAYPYVIKI